MLKPITIRTPDGHYRVWARFDFNTQYFYMDTLQHSPRSQFEIIVNASQCQIQLVRGSTIVTRDTIHRIIFPDIVSQTIDCTKPGTIYQLRNWGSVHILPDPAPQIQQQQLREFLQGA